MIGFMDCRRPFSARFGEGGVKGLMCGKMVGSSGPQFVQRGTTVRSWKQSSALVQRRMVKIDDEQLVGSLLQ